jgi:arsenite methyltransferase
MAIACPIDLDTRVLRSEVSKVYSRVATDPNGDFHFHRGPAYAAEFLGYDPDELAAIPKESTASFAGIANPHIIAPIVLGEKVLDIGCGAGTDLLLAARRVGTAGSAIGIDMTETMRDRARASAVAAGLSNVEVHSANATSLKVHLQNYRRVCAQCDRKWLGRRLNSYRGLVQLRIEFTHLLISTTLTSQCKCHSCLVLNRHSRVCKCRREAAVGPHGDTLARQKCGFRLQMLKLDVLGLAKHGNRLAARIAGLKRSAGHLDFKREDGHTHRWIVVDG